jgi:beta-xylosidase
MTTPHQFLMVSVIAGSLLMAGCQDKSASTTETSANSTAPSAVAPLPTPADPAKFPHQPLVSDIFTANPSANVFNGKLYVYVAQDLLTNTSNSDQLAAKDYRVLSTDSLGSPVTVEDIGLTQQNVAWANGPLWSPAAAEKDGTFFLFFPAQNKEGIFQIGVATSKSPAGPFSAEAEPIKGSFSTDPAILKDDDGTHYIYFGSLGTGQLQRWTSGSYTAEDKYPVSNEPAIGPKIARLSDDLRQFAEAPKDIQILDAGDAPLLGTDSNRQFFGAAWVHKHNGKYYISYPTGDNRIIAYAIGDNPYGPFTHKGLLLTPVFGGTTHHSIVKQNDKWHIFYHDAQLSGGQGHLRNVKASELVHNDDGTITPIVTYLE